MNLEKDIINILETLKKIDERLSILENKVIINNNEEQNIMEVKIQEFIIDKDIIIKCLEHNDIKYDLNLIKKIYFENINIKCIKYNNNKNIEYWNNRSWNIDINILYDILIKNVINSYLIINNFDNYSNNIEQFMKNQTYIMGMSDEKYKEKFIKAFKILLE